VKNILQTQVSRKELSAVAMGHIKADKVIKNGNLIDVYTGRIRRADIAIKGERIALVGDAGHTIGAGTQVIDAGGNYLSPGLMDAHIHIEASMVSPGQFARAVLPRGNTAVNWETLWAAGELECVLPSPLMTLAFAGCPTLVEFKLSDKGLINILEGSLAPLEAD